MISGATVSPRKGQLHVDAVAIADAMNQHFIEHPFATVAKAPAADASVDSALSGEADSPLRLTYSA